MIDILNHFKFKKEYNRLLKEFPNMENEIRLLNDRVKMFEESNQRLCLPYDSLTMVYQRSSVLAVLDNEIINGQKGKSRVTAAIFDIDFMKMVNDVYGFSIADKSLADIATIIKNNLKINHAFLGRTAGDEFTIVFPETDCNLVVNECRKIQESIEEGRISNGVRDAACRIHESILPKFCGREYITVSIGILSKVPSTDDTYESFMQQLEEILYLTKKNGYNSLKIHEC